MSFTTMSALENKQGTLSSLVYVNSFNEFTPQATEITSRTKPLENSNLRIVFDSCGLDCPFIVSSWNFHEKNRIRPQRDVRIRREFPEWLIYGFSIKNAFYPNCRYYMPPREAVVRAIKDGLQCISDGKLLFHETPFLVLLSAHWIAESMNLRIFNDLENIIAHHESSSARQREATNEGMILNHFTVSLLNVSPERRESRYNRQKSFYDALNDCERVLSLNQTMNEENENVWIWERRIRRSLSSTSSSESCCVCF